MTTTIVAIATKTIVMKVQEIAVSSLFLHAVNTVYKYFHQVIPGQMSGGIPQSS